jgi:hypothetical protein
VKIRNSKFEIRNKPQLGNERNSDTAPQRVWIFLPFLLAICFVLRISNFGFASTTQPSQITTWFNDLANRDASVRQQARVNLMGISRGDLETLRKLVETTRPLAPAQAMALREIVDQVYQSTDPYEPIEDHAGFLGVPLPPAAVVVDGADEESQGGMLVASRIRGFCAFRFLQDGDVILAIEGHAIRTSNDLQAVIAKHKGGDVIQVEVLRGGEKIQVPLKLDTRPAWAPVPPVPGLTQDTLRERQRKADEYWDKYFAPLLDAGLL